jgi:peptidoglycan/LPS O-acetylase OafA/YrhL
VPTKTHVTYLDTIRGLAALTVITEHFIIAYGLPCENALCQKILDSAPLNFWWNGSAAVSMFFVLSGLVLSLKYFRLGHSPDLQSFNLSGYIIGRLFRIWLPYCVILLVSAGLYLQTVESPMLKTIIPPSDWIIEMWHNHPLTVTDMVRESFLLNLPDMVVLLPQAWTLTIELVLSLLLPVGLLLAERGTAWLIFFALLAVTLLGVSFFLLHFLLGLMIARHYPAIAGYLERNNRQRRLVLLIGLFLYTSGGVMEGQVGENGVWLASGLGAGLILLFVMGSVGTQAFLSHPALRQIGRASYSAYLIHMLILLCLTPYLLKWLESLTIDHSGLWFGGYILTLLIVQLLSLLSYHWLEVPSVAMGRRIVDGIRSWGCPELK